MLESGEVRLERIILSPLLNFTGIPKISTTDLLRGRKVPVDSPPPKGHIRYTAKIGTYSGVSYQRAAEMVRKLCVGLGDGHKSSLLLITRWREFEEVENVARLKVGIFGYF